MIKKTLLYSLLAFAGLVPTYCLPTGQIYGEATYYNDAGFGACGTQINANSQKLVAIPQQYWTSSNHNNDPICGVKVKVSFNGKHVILPVRDLCPSCPSNNIDISVPAFLELSGSLDAGRINVVWELVNDNGNGNPTQGTIGSTTTGGNTCQKQVTVEAGQGCWDVWTSKCHNEWNENQFYNTNPETDCLKLKVGQSLCCGGISSNTGTVPTPNVPPTNNGKCQKQVTVEAGQGCWDVWTSKCHNEWNENQFYNTNPGTDCLKLKVGQSLCCGGISSNIGSDTNSQPSKIGTCQKQVTVESGQGCWDVWTSKCHNEWNENQFYNTNPGTDCLKLKVGQSLCCN